MSQFLLDCIYFRIAECYRKYLFQEKCGMTTRLPKRFCNVPAIVHKVCSRKFVRNSYSIRLLKIRSQFHSFIAMYIIYIVFHELSVKIFQPMFERLGGGLSAYAVVEPVG